MRRNQPVVRNRDEYACVLSNGEKVVDEARCPVYNALCEYRIASDDVCINASTIHTNPAMKIFLLLCILVSANFSSVNILFAQEKSPKGILGCSWGMSQLEVEKILREREDVKISHEKNYPDVLLVKGLSFSGRKVNSSTFLFRDGKLYAVKLTLKGNFEEEYLEVRKEFESEYGMPQENVTFYNIRFNLSDFDELVKTRSGGRKYSSAWSFDNGTVIALDIDDFMNPTVIYQNFSFIESERRSRKFGTIGNVPGSFCSGPMTALRILNGCGW